MKIGTARIDITPTAIVDLSGYGGRINPMTGIHDKLTARAIYLVNKAGQRLLWIHADIVAISNETAAELKAAILARHGLAPEEVVISATHTHSGPATIELINCGKIDPGYMAYFHKQLLIVAGEALRETAEAEVVAGAGSSTIAIDRRNKAYPEMTAHVDPRIGIVGFRRTDGTWIAVLATYTMHNTMLNYDNRELSGDVAGHVETYLENKLPGRPAVMFTNGPCANNNPPKKTVDFAEVAELAAQLAEAAAEGLKNTKPIGDETIRAALRTVPLPLDSIEVSTEYTKTYLSQIDDRDKKVKAIANTDDPTGYIKRQLITAAEYWLKTTAERAADGTIAHYMPVPIHVVGIGPLRLVCVGAEVFSRIRQDISKAVGCDVTVVGYANGYNGYVATKEGFEEGGYEPNMSFIFAPARLRNAPGGFELIRDHAIEMLKEMK